MNIFYTVATKPRPSLIIAVEVMKHVGVDVEISFIGVEEFEKLAGDKANLEDPFYGKCGDNEVRNLRDLFWFLEHSALWPVAFCHH